MLNACVVSLVKSPFAESPVHVYLIAYFMQWAHLHKRAKGCCKTQVSGCGDSDLFSFSVRMNGGIMTANITETDSVNYNLA